MTEYELYWERNSRRGEYEKQASVWIYKSLKDAREECYNLIHESKNSGLNVKSSKIISILGITGDVIKGGELFDAGYVGTLNGHVVYLNAYGSYYYLTKDGNIKKIPNMTAHKTSNKLRK